MSKLAVYTTFLLLIGILPIQAQHSEVYYIELLGANVAYSVNGDYRFSNKSHGPGFRIGFGIAPSEYETLIGIPIQLNFLSGAKRHKLEAGFGLSTFYSISSDDIYFEFYPSVTVMYRFQPEDRHFVFRAGFSPVFIPDFFYNSINGLWPGLSFGRSF